MLRFLTAGESHGKCLTAIIEGLPSGIELTEKEINKELFRRQQGYGRGGRMRIEKDQVEITAGLRHGKTLGSPLCLVIHNRDFENWKQVMSTSPDDASDARSVTRPRPGHADLSGGIKYRHEDLRNILERASARETAIKVAVGAVAKSFLAHFGISLYSYVASIGSEAMDAETVITSEAIERIEASPVRCPDEAAEARMIKAIDAAKAAGDSLGGTFRIVICSVPVGLGTHVHWDRRLDANLARALMSIQAIKGVEVGMGFQTAREPGSKVHDEIAYKDGFYHKTNNAGGIEGGISNGEEIIVTCAMKPIPTLYTPLQSVDFLTKEPFAAGIERSDICAVPAAAVVGEAMAAFVIADAMMEKFGGDSIKETLHNYHTYLAYLRKL